MKNIDVTFLHEMDDMFSDFEDLPFNEGMHKRTDIDIWKYWGRNYHLINNKYPYKIIDHILSKFIGKSINKAFRYYCTIVPKYMQNYFWEQIEKEKWINWRYRRPGYYIDNGGNVRKQKKENPPRRFIYIGEEKVTDKKVTYFHKSHPKYGRRLPPVEEEIESVIYEQKYYEGTKGYARTMAEKQQHKLDKEIVENYYDFNRIKRKKKANEEDELIRDRHGFDKKSFKGIEYHGQKRKREKKKDKLKSTS